MSFDGVVRARKGEIVCAAGRTALARAHRAAINGARFHDPLLVPRGSRAIALSPTGLQ
jgi:hypothetical protein